MIHDSLIRARTLDGNSSIFAPALSKKGEGLGGEMLTIVQLFIYIHTVSVREIHSVCTRTRTA